MAIDRDANAHASSTGQAQTGIAWLDAHFESNRSEYEAQVRAVGIQPGWRVLDAGCGGGSFLPWLADLVGPSGHVSALDLAPDNIAVVEARLSDWQLGTPIEAQVGSVLSLPYPDNCFDAVWFANTSQYLTDAELRAAVSEMQRVARPGGLVALKEADATLHRILPAPFGLLLHSYEASMRAGNAQSYGCLRACMLPAFLHAAGLVAIRRQTTLIERSAPLPAISRDQWRSYLVFAANRYSELDVSDEDRAFWLSLREPADLDRFVNDADFYGCEGNTLVVGRVPEA